MFKKESTYLHQKDDDFEVALAALQHLRKQFLTVPFEKFVHVETLRQSLPDDPKVREYVRRLDSRLDFGTDSFRYFMRYLKDAKTAKVADRDSWHDVHTDFRGRCDIRNAHMALGYAMGFRCIEEDLAVDRWGYEADPGAVEETVSTELGDVLISGYKNARGNYHGYCQIEQSNGVLQNCFFDDGRILARRIYYTNGMSEDIKDNPHMAVDPFSPRTVYEVIEDHGNSMEFQETAIERDLAEKIFNTLAGYSLEMKCVYERRYPYDDDTYYETESDSCTPGLDMAIIQDGKLWGVALMTDGHRILPLDEEMYSSSSRWGLYAVELDNNYSEGDLTISLSKKST